MIAFAPRIGPENGQLYLLAVTDEQLADAWKVALSSEPTEVCVRAAVAVMRGATEMEGLTAIIPPLTLGAAFGSDAFDLNLAEFLGFVLTADAPYVGYPGKAVLDFLRERNAELPVVTYSHRRRQSHWHQSWASLATSEPTH